jgi:hypothetical protein
MADLRPFRIFTAAASLATAAVAVALAIGSDLPDLGRLGVLVALMIYSEHRSVAVSDGAVVNADFMVMMAAVVAFHEAGALLGPLIVGASRGVYIPLIRQRAWAVCAANASSGGLAAAATAVVLKACPPGALNQMPRALVVSLMLATVCASTLWLVFALSLSFRERQPARTLIGMFAPSAVESLPFLVLGFFLGRLYLSLGPIAALMLIVPMFIAREVFASYLRVKESHDETVQMLIRALETKDHYTAGHSERVAKYAEYMGEEFHFGPGRMERLRCAALMHDIGKLVVPNHILNKPGKLTEEEFARVRLHEKVSVQMLSHIDFLRPVAAQTDSANMRFDPDDERHPIEPYMVMIGDAYDAMTSTRSYRKALSQEVAFRELRDKAGTQFHPACVEALIRAIEKRGEVHGAGHEEQSDFEHAPDAGLGSAGLGDLLPSET